MGMNIYPGAVTPSHPISLSDGVQTFGLTLAKGDGAIEEVPLMPSTLVYFEGQPRYGDGKPGIGHVEQRTWIGGRGREDFLEDPTGYADGKMAWTLTPGKVFPAPMWQFGKGYVTAYENMPGDLGWRAMYGSGSNRYTAQKFTHAVDWAGVNQLFIWVRKIGSPRDLTVGLYPDSLGAPDTNSPYDTATLLAGNVSEYETALVTLDVSGAGALSGTESWLLAAANGLDNAANRWEIGVDVDSGEGAYWDGGSWLAADFSLYYRLAAAPTDRKWHFFEYLGALYAVDQKANGGAAVIFINGDRGKRTNSDATSITDSNKSWADNAWAGAWVRIVRGKGGGQERAIAANSSTELFIGDPWKVVPDGTSEFVIYHTERWTSITPSSGDVFTSPVVTAAVIDDQVHFGCGGNMRVMKMRWNNAATPPAHEFDYDNAATYADHFITVTDETNGTQLYRFRYILGSYCFFARASYTAWGTEYTYGTAVDIGSKSQPINGVCVHDGKLYAFKSDGRYRISPEDTVVKDLGEVGLIPDGNNGEALLSHGLDLYYSWGGYALQRLSGSGSSSGTASIGPDRGAGLPGERAGRITALVGFPAGILAAVDAGQAGTSSVLGRLQDGSGWHEVFRSWGRGAKVGNIRFQDDLRPRLWISAGGELVYQDWPKDGLNPLKDGGMTYVPEAQVVSSTMDFGAARRPKLIKEIGVACETISGECAVYLDYQTNADVGTERWTQAGRFQLNPADSLPLDLGEVYQLRYRLRMVSEKADVPVVVNAAVLEGFARTPVKYGWTLRLAVPGDDNPDEFVGWLKAAAVQARRITMRSIWAQMDGKSVAVEPPSSLLAYTNTLTGEWGGEVELRLREI